MPGTTSGPYDIGDVVRLSISITVSGTATDPGGISLVHRKPDGTSTTVTSGSMSHSSTGHYYYDLTIDQTGLWFYRYTTTGTAAGVEESSFFVRPQEF